MPSRLRTNSKAPQLELNFSASPLQISSEYVFSDLGIHRQSVVHSDSSSLSSFETSSSCSPPSSPRLNGAPSHLTIAIQSLEELEDEETSSPAMSQKDKRPLPPVPRSDLSPKIRPLPPTPKTNAVSISVTPATPLPPPTPTVESPHHLSLPRIRLLPKPLEIHSCSNLCAPPSYQLSQRDSLLPSPDSIFLPELPTPATARQRRLSKLKRYLGETVPDELVPVISSARDPRAATELLAHLRSLAQLESDMNEPLNPVAISRKLKELENDSALSDDEDDLIFLDEDEEVESIIEDSELLPVEGKAAFVAVALQKYSKKWMWDKGGNRREENDYADILRALRSL
ncbi:hypothetical protein D9757_012544 [Collybiopsis confluens]|uniref:Uncharacterized protein n=1 Tax=Collybiopsis confluens TaxID=2823264 RepID=A0A8H5G0C0_9AGAR|nr:hypothetical protein D9757_012544 [Collybiopsis confluens]